MAQKTVLKVTIPCEKCKKKLLKSVTSLQGVDKIEVDEAKGTLTVTGEVDPYKVIVRARKAGGRHAEVVSIGAPPAPAKKPEEKKAEEKKKDEKKAEEKKKEEAKVPYNPCSHHRGEIAFVHLGPYQEPNPICSIL